MEINNNEKEESLTKLIEGWTTQVRGDDPQDYQKTCLQLCQRFLGSYWLKLELKDIEIERLVGGMTNQIYRCKALTTNGVEDNETPNEAVIRFYGEKYDVKTCPKGCRFYDGLIAWIASNEGYGTKMYGMFEGGQVLKYYQHRLMNGEDLNNPLIVSKLAQILAKFHHLKPPIGNKNSDWVNEYLITEADPLVEEVIPRLKPLLEKYDCKELVDLDLKKEIQWLNKFMDEYDSPIVFSHNDFRMGNVFVIDNNDIVLTDFDYSVYAFRGIDFVGLFGCGDDNLENMFADNESSPIRQFIAYYIEECERMFGTEYSDDPLNSVQHIHKEMKLGLPLFYLWFAMTTFAYQSDMMKEIGEEETMKTFNHFIVQYNASKVLLAKYKLI